MHCVRTVSRHNYRVKSGKHLPWHSVLSVNQYFARARWDWNLDTALFFFFVPKRDTRQGMENHFFSYMSQCQTLKPCTCCLWHRDEPFPLTSQSEQKKKKKDKGHPFPSHPFFIAFFQLWISISVVLQNTSWHWLKVLFCLRHPWKVASIVGHVIYVDSGIDYI